MVFVRVVLALSLFLTTPVFGAGPKKNRKGMASQESVPEAMTGCLDQRGSGYFLAGEQMKEEAELRAKGFSDDNFARLIGHTVRVQGKVDRSSGKVIVQVSKVEDVRESCR